MVERWLKGLVVLFILTLSGNLWAASSQCYLPDYTVLNTGTLDRENLIYNGSFEEGHDLLENKWGLFDVVPGWQKSDPSGPSIEIQNGPTIGGLNPIEGSAKVELDSNGNSSFKQLIPVESGYSYHLRFNYSARQNGNPDSNGIQVLVDGVEVLSEQINRKGWRTQSFFVVATSNELEVEFIGTGTSDGIGVYLDNVGLYQSNFYLELNDIDNPSFEIGHGLDENKWSIYESLGAWQAGTKLSAIKFEVQKGATIGGLAPSDGLQKIELDGKKNAAILQEVPSISQSTYQLSFDYSPRTTNEDTNLMELWVDNEFIATISSNQKGFVRYDFDILARYDSLKVEFRGAGTSDGLGAYLDNVVLSLNGGNNLLVNGSFEEDLGLGDNKWSLYQSIPGWTASIEENVIVPFEIQNGETVGGFFAGDANTKLEMDAHENSAVFQDLNLDQNRMYLLSLLYTPRVNGDLETNKVGVYFEGEKIGELNGTQKGWKPFEFIVKPELITSRIEFRAEGTSDSYGGYIDQVNLNQISNCELNQAPVGQIITNVFNPERPFDVNHFFEGYDPDGYVVSVDWILADLTPATGNFIPYQYDLEAGTYPVTMTVTDDLGAQTIVTKDIELGRPVPQVIVTASAYEGIAPFDVDLDASSSFSDNGAIVAYEWVDTVGDLVAETPELYLTLEEPGDYFYTVFVRDELGYVGVYGVTINVFEENQNQRPVAAIQTNIYDPLRPFNVDHFSNAYDPDGIIVSEEWVLLDGTTAIGTHVNKIYELDPGTYNLTLTVTDNLGATDSLTVPVTLGLPLPTPVVSVDHQSGTAPLTVTFDASGSYSENGPIVSFEWEVGDDEFYNPESFDPIFTRTFEEPGSYPVYLGIADSEGVYSFYSTTIDVFPSSSNIPPVADFNFNIYNPERPFSVGHFSQSYDPDGFIVSEEWVLADGSTAYGSIVDMNYDLDPGIYDVTLRVTDGEGAQSEITKQIELGLPLPVPVVNIDQPSGEAPLTVTFDASSSFSDNGQIVGYSWEVGDDGIYNPESYDPVFTRTFEEPGNYPVYLAINDEKGVFAFYSVNIEVTDPYQFEIISSFNKVYVGEEIEFRIDTEAIYSSVQWEVNGIESSSSSDFIQTFNSPGSQTITATVTFSDSNQISKSRSINVLENFAPQARVDLIEEPSGYRRQIDGTGVSVERSKQLRLSATGTNDLEDQLVSYEWEILETGEKFYGQEVLIKFVDSSSRTLKMTATDSSGLSESISFPVTINHRTCDEETSLQVNYETEYCLEVINLNANNFLNVDQIIAYFGDFPQLMIGPYNYFDIYLLSFEGEKISLLNSFSFHSGLINVDLSDHNIKSNKYRIGLKVTTSDNESYSAESDFFYYGTSPILLDYRGGKSIKVEIYSKSHNHSIVSQIFPGLNEINDLPKGIYNIVSLKEAEKIYGTISNVGESSFTLEPSSIVGNSIGRITEFGATSLTSAFFSSISSQEIDMFDENLIKYRTNNILPFNYYDEHGAIDYQAASNILYVKTGEYLSTRTSATGYYEKFLTTPGFQKINSHKIRNFQITEDKNWIYLPEKEVDISCGLHNLGWQKDDNDLLKNSYNEYLLSLSLVEDFNLELTELSKISNKIRDSYDQQFESCNGDVSCEIQVRQNESNDPELNQIAIETQFIVDQKNNINSYLDEEPRRTYAHAYREIMTARLYDFTVDLIVSNRADEDRVEVIHLGTMKNNNLVSTDLWDHNNIPDTESFFRPIKSSFKIELPSFDELRKNGIVEENQDTNYYDLEFVVSEFNETSGIGIEDDSANFNSSVINLHFQCWRDYLDDKLQITSLKARYNNQDSNGYDFEPSEGPSSNLNGIKSLESNLLPISVDNYDSGNNNSVLRNAFNYFNGSYPVEFEVLVKKNDPDITPFSLKLYIEAEEDNLDESLNVLGANEEILLEDLEEQTVVFEFDAGLLREKLISKFGPEGIDDRLRLVVVPTYEIEENNVLVKDQSKAYIKTFDTNYDIREVLGLSDEDLYAVQRMSLFGTAPLVDFVNDVRNGLFLDGNGQAANYVRFNDGSLPFGGLFRIWNNVDQTWEWEHDGHKDGRRVDISYPIEGTVAFSLPGGTTIPVDYNVNSQGAGKVRDIIRILSFQTEVLQNADCLPIVLENQNFCSSVWSRCFNSPESSDCTIYATNEETRAFFVESRDRIGRYVVNMRELLRVASSHFTEKPGRSSNFLIENSFKSDIEAATSINNIDQDWHTNLIKLGSLPDRFYTPLTYGGKRIGECGTYCNYLVHWSNHFNHIHVNIGDFKED